MKCNREIFIALLELDFWLVQIEWFNVNQIPFARWCKVEGLTAVKTPADALEGILPR